MRRTDTNVNDIPAGLRRSIGGGIVIATATTAFIQLQKFRYVADLRRWDRWCFAVLAGAVVGAFFWILIRPQARLTRGILTAIVVNWTAWAVFLLSTAPLQDFEFQEIAKQRATRDADSGLNLMTDQPTIIASRWFGGFRPMPISERLLFLMAGVPVLAASEYVVPARYAGDPPNRGESWVIAIFGFSMSTAFWASAGGAVGWFRRRRSTVNG